MHVIIHHAKIGLRKKNGVNGNGLSVFTFVAGQ